MALKVSLSQEQSGIGVAIPEAYCRIVAVQWPTQEGKLAFGVEYHWDEAARRANLRPVGGQAFAVDDFDFSSDVGLKKSLYGYLKTLEAFAGAQDA